VELAMRLLLLVRTTVILLLCTGAAKAADPMLLAETGGFLLGNAHRCDVSAERIIRAGQVIVYMIDTVSQDASEKDAANARFADAFSLSSTLAATGTAFSPPCEAIVTQFERLERHHRKAGFTD
jgi:hypothetical protein